MHFFSSFCELSCARGCTKCTGLLTWPLVAIVHRDWMGRARALCVSSELLLDAFAKLKVLHVNVCRVVGGSLRRDGEVRKRLGSVLAESRWFCFAVLRGRIAFFFFLLCCQKGRLVVSSHVLIYALPRDILVIQHCTFRGLMLCTFVSSRSGVDAGTIACVHVLHEPSRMGLRRALDGSLWKREVWPSPVENLQKRQQKRDKSSQTVALSTPPLCLHDGPNGPRGISFINRMIS